MYRRAGEHSCHRHLLNTPRQWLDAEDWLREHLDNEIIDPQTACLTRGNDQTSSVEVVVGEILDFLAGKIETVPGFPDVAEAVR